MRWFDSRRCPFGPRPVSVRTSGAAPAFHDLMFNRGEPYFYAFDVLHVDGVDLRDLPL